MEDYHGMYEMHISLRVSASTHDTCRWISSRFKYLVKAFDFGNIQIREGKSARKGDVLTRDLSICVTAYATNLLIFRECIDRLVSSCNIWHSQLGSVSITNSHTTRKDAHRDLIKETL